MSIATWLGFITAATVLLIIPGPTILTVISYAMAHGRRVNLPLIAAVTLGDSTALVLSMLGLGALLRASVAWFAVIKIAGGLYLIFLGLKMLRAGAVSSEGLAPTPKLSPARLFVNTYLVTALNPKGIVFFVAFLPQFINSTAPVGPQLWLLATTFVVLATTNATLYAAFASSARRLLDSQRAQRRFNVSGALLLSAAGVWALFAKRPA